MDYLGVNTTAKDTVVEIETIQYTETVIEDTPKQPSKFSSPLFLTSFAVSFLLLCLIIYLFKIKNKDKEKPIKPVQKKQEQPVEPVNDLPEIDPSKKLFRKKMGETYQYFQQKDDGTYQQVKAPKENT